SWPEQVVQHFNFTSRRARQFIHDLQAEGLIEPSTHEFDKDAYQLTDKGRSLGRGSAAKAIIRATGDKALKGLLQRAKEVNASEDRKSTRLNSSHVKISYAVFCLK